MRPRVVAMLTVALVLAGCGGQGEPKASLSIDEIHAMAEDIADAVSEATDVACDPGGTSGVANCYVGMNTADEDAAIFTLCNHVLPVVKEHTSGRVGLYAYNAADDQVITVARC